MFKLILTGNVGRKPSLHNTKDGKPVVEFPIAVSVRKDVTEWVKVSCWNQKQHDLIMQYVDIGSKLLIEGSPSANAWLDKEGTPKASIQLMLNTFEFVGSKKDGTEERGGQDNAYQSHNVINESKSIASDDVPF